MRTTESLAKRLYLERIKTHSGNRNAQRSFKAPFVGNDQIVSIFWKYFCVCLLKDFQNLMTFHRNVAGSCKDSSSKINLLHLNLNMAALSKWKSRTLKNFIKTWFNRQKILIFEMDFCPFFLNDASANKFCWETHAIYIELSFILSQIAARAVFWNYYFYLFFSLINQLFFERNWRVF